MYKEQLGDKLKSARERAGYTQTQVSDILNIPQNKISKLENNIIEPNIETLGRLIDFYEISADWLLGTGITKK